MRSKVRVPFSAVSFVSLLPADDSALLLAPVCLKKSREEDCVRGTMPQIRRERRKKKKQERRDKNLNVESGREK